MSFRITNLETVVIKIPLKNPMFLSGRCISHAENIIVKIESDGLVGWGESASAPRMTGDTVSGMNEIINRWFKTFVIGQEISNYKKIISDIDKMFYGNTGAKFAVYSALLDLYCRANDVSLHQLLGKKIRNDIASLRILANETIEDDLNEAEACYLSGVNFFKVKIGKHNIDDEISLVHRLREIIHNSNLCVDSNSGISTESFEKFVRETSRDNILFIEDCNSLDLGVSVCLDQDIFTCKDIREMMNLGTGQGVNLKLMKFSDPFKLVEAANLTNDLGLNVNLSGKIAETGIASSVLLNCAAVAPNINWGVSTTNQYLLQDIITKTDSSNFEPVIVDEYLVKQFKYTDV